MSKHPIDLIPLENVRPAPEGPICTWCFDEWPVAGDTDEEMLPHKLHLLPAEQIAALTGYPLTEPNYLCGRCFYELSGDDEP